MKKYTISAFVLFASYTVSSAFSASPLIKSVSVPTFSVQDFLVQDVCLNASGTVLSLSPTSSKCASTRNLKPKEYLPYHKDDQPGNDTNPADVSGFHRSDSFPSADGASIVQTFDFGSNGNTFGVKDIKDGFNVYETRGSVASLIATANTQGGVQYFVSSPCNPKAKSFKDSNDAWIVASTTLQVGVSGKAVSKLAGANTPSVCPDVYDESLATWSIPTQKVGYTSGDQLVSLVSFRYSHKFISDSDHFEKFYFTREFGPTRWERWERTGTTYHTDEKVRANAQSASQVCNGSSEAQDSIGMWYRVDCREWTNIVVTPSPEKPQDWSVTAAVSPVVVATIPATLAVSTMQPVVLGAFTSSTNVSTVACTKLTKNLYRGKEGSSVEALQNFLFQKGLLNEIPSGFYGDKTVDAVKVYQASAGLKVSGMVYEGTREAIMAETCHN
jgi:hypothetical protein